MPRKAKQYHYIYKTTCVITNKYYIGMHSAVKLNDGYLGFEKKIQIGFTIKLAGRIENKHFQSNLKSANQKLILQIKH